MAYNDPEKRRATERAYARAHREQKAESKERYRAKNPEWCLWVVAKERAKKQGVPFTIAVSDIVIPEFCPILSIRLEKGKQGFCETSPTLDKIVPGLGYVPGNVMVISFRANRIKSDASVEEMRKIVEWRRKFEANKMGQPEATPL